MTRIRYEPPRRLLILKIMVVGALAYLGYIHIGSVNKFNALSLSRTNNNDFFSSFWKHHDSVEKNRILKSFDSGTFARTALAQKEVILARIKSDTKKLYDSLNQFQRLSETASSLEEKIFNLENAAMLQLELNGQSDLFRQAAKVSSELGLNYKKELYNRIEKNIKLQPPIHNDIVRKIDVPEGANTLVLGKSAIHVSNNSRLFAQSDRVLTDWYSGMYRDIFSEVDSHNIIPWHEGKMINEILRGLSLTNTKFDFFSLNKKSRHSKNTLNMTLVYDTFAFQSTEGKWYAPDEKGVPRFEVLVDKIQYPSTKRAGTVAFLNDTHGISSLVAQAVNGNASVVLGCGDTPGKMHAASYLSEKGIDVFFQNDRFSGLVLGYQSPGILMGTAPIRKEGDSVVIGSQPIEVSLNETIIVQNTNLLYPGQYYDAPRRYFDELQKVSGVKLKTIIQNVKTIKETYKVTDLARKQNSNVIAVRVAYEEDAKAVEAWLAENENNRAILFHSASYDPGYMLFEKFPLQTSFGDLKPIFIKK